MLGSGLIVFREVLEAALVIAVVLGASRGVARRGQWVAGGVLVGLLGAAVVAAFASTIAGAVEGRGQELFNAGVLLLAVGMLAWHNIWMKSHGRELASNLRVVGSDVRVGARPLSALALVTMFAVLREGSEAVLFLYGIATSGAGASQLLIGCALGLAGGCAVGWLLYRGLIAIPVGYFFGVVGWIVLLLAAGLSAGAAGYLNQAGLLPSFGLAIWDTSDILSQQGWLGALLHILIGYYDRPMGIQVVFYVVTLVFIGAMMWIAGRGSKNISHLASEAGD